MRLNTTPNHKQVYVQRHGLNNSVWSQLRDEHVMAGKIELECGGRGSKTQDNIPRQMHRFVQCLDEYSEAGSSKCRPGSPYESASGPMVSRRRRGTQLDQKVRRSPRKLENDTLDLNKCLSYRCALLRSETKPRCECDWFVPQASMRARAK